MQTGVRSRMLVLDASLVSLRFHRAHRGRARRRPRSRQRRGADAARDDARAFRAPRPAAERIARHRSRFRQITVENAHREQRRGPRSRRRRRAPHSARRARAGRARDADASRAPERHAPDQRSRSLAGRAAAPRVRGDFRSAPLLLRDEGDRRAGPRATIVAHVGWDNPAPAPLLPNRPPPPPRPLVAPFEVGPAEGATSPISPLKEIVSAAFTIPQDTPPAGGPVPPGTARAGRCAATWFADMSIAPSGRCATTTSRQPGKIFSALDRLPLRSIRRSVGCSATSLSAPRSRRNPGHARGGETTPRPGGHHPPSRTARGFTDDLIPSKKRPGTGKERLITRIGGEFEQVRPALEKVRNAPRNANRRTGPI